MNLDVISITPEDGSNFIPIDAEITIEFNQNVDPFTIMNGISIYVLTEAGWTGSILSVLDSKYSDVLDIGPEYTYFPLRHVIDGSTVRITPVSGLIPNKKHYIQIAPGNDATRFLSFKTFSAPEYTRIGSSNGIVAVASAYTGASDDTIVLMFSDSSYVDASTSNGTSRYQYEAGKKINMGSIDIIIDGTFDDGDLVTIDVFNAKGLTTVVKSTFNTTAYATTTPTSTRIDSLNDIVMPLKIVGTTPGDMSVNNDRTNPIIIRFNKKLAADTDIASKVNITKTDINTGRTRTLKHSSVISENMLKIYLRGVE